MLLWATTCLKCLSVATSRATVPCFSTPLTRVHRTIVLVPGSPETMPSENLPPLSAFAARARGEPSASGARMTAAANGAPVRRNWRRVCMRGGIPFPGGGGGGLRATVQEQPAHGGRVASPARLFPPWAPISVIATELGAHDW